MDCTHCESVLLDLCYGELTPAHERDVRAHIHECANCRKALSRLEAGQALARHLPDEPPPPELTERIMRAAEAHARRNNGGFLERVQLVMESMARIAMTRQVAMATLSLLIVFVGLWSIPELTRRREAHTAMVAPPTAEGEAGPSREVPPVAPAPVAQAPVPEPEATKVASSRAGSPDRARPRAASGRAAAPDPAAKRADKAERRREGDTEAARPVATAAPATPAKEQKGRFAQPPPPAAEVPADAKATAEELALAKPKPAKEATAPAAESSSAHVDDLLGGLGATTQSANASPASTSASIEDVFRAGVERYRADDFPAAVQLFSRMLESSAPSAQRAAALLYLARSERALGRCERAIRAYETLVRSYGSSQQSASALSEGVACYDQLGNAAGATRLLEHASSVPSLSVQASKTLQDRNTGKPAAPAAAAEPAPR